jgi:hypothetical protein
MAAEPHIGSLRPNQTRSSSIFVWSRVPLKVGENKKGVEPIRYVNLRVFPNDQWRLGKLEMIMPTQIASYSSARLRDQQNLSGLTFGIFAAIVLIGLTIVSVALVGANAVDPAILVAP